MKNSIAKTVMIGGSITGGFVAGMLFSKGLQSGVFKNRKPITKSLSRPLDVLTLKGEHIKSSLGRFYEENIAHPVPDLYRATEGLTLSEYDLLDE